MTCESAERRSSSLILYYSLLRNIDQAHSLPYPDYADDFSKEDSRVPYLMYSFCHFSNSSVRMIRRVSS